MSIPINLVVEGDLDISVLSRLVAQTDQRLVMNVPFVQTGRSILQQNIGAFNQASRVIPHLVLTDLETDECAPLVAREWFPHGRNPNLLFRVAERMVESWLLADRSAFAEFLSVPLNRIPTLPDQVPHPKKLIAQIARRSRFRTIREGVAPPSGSARVVGPDYVGQMTRFVNQIWDIPRASANSPSLARALRAIQDFNPSTPYS